MRNFVFSSGTYIPARAPLRWRFIGGLKELHSGSIQGIGDRFELHIGYLPKLELDLGNPSTVNPHTLELETRCQFGLGKFGR